MNTITLTYDGTTKALADWGFTYCTLHLKSRAASVLILDRGGEQPEGAPVIPYGGQITLAVAMGDGSTYFWKGKRRDFNGHAHPDAPKTSLQFEDVWGALERTTFQHFWQMSDGSGHVTNKYFSRINLFQDIHSGPGVAWVYLTADNQIRQIIDFAQTECGSPVQVGAVDPIWNMPVFAVKAISCAYALQVVMKPMPDMVTAMDYSTTPPTIHFRQRTNCSPITLPYAGTDIHGRHHKQTQIKPRPDLQVPAVVIQYQITGTIDGAAYNDTAVDAYPPNSTGLEENALVFPVDLRGPSRTNVKGTLITEAINPATEAFWKEHKPDLANADLIIFDPINPIVDTSINTGTQYGITIEDSSGATVDLSDYPNKLISGQPAQWMLVDGSAVEAFEVTIKATLRYKKYFPLDASIPPTHKMLTHDYENHVVEVRLRLTDAPLGTTNYSVTGSSDSGDPIPQALAYVIWCSVNNIAVNYEVVDGVTVAVPPATVPNITAPDNYQWEGEHEVVENMIYSIATPANVLNLSGGNADWANMNAVIYGVDIDFFNGRTGINFGPFKHLQAAEYFEMVMAFRYRQVFDNPNLRNTGQAGSAGSTDLGNNSPKENTTHGTPDAHADMVHGPDPTTSTSRIQITRDASNNGGQLLLQTVKNDNTVDTAKPQVQLSQSDLGTINDAGVTGRIAKWRKVVCLDASTGAAQQFVVAASDEETTSVTIASSAIKLTINSASGAPDIYANYFIGLQSSVTTTATFGSGVSSITVGSASGIKIGMMVSGTHIPANTAVTSISGTTIGISNNTTGTQSGTYTFAALIRVAKNAKLRNAISSQTIDGVSWSYSYTNPTSRTATSGGYSEYQRVVERYLASDEIWAMPVANGDIGSLTSVPDTISATPGAPIVYVDMNIDGREWAAKADQSSA